MHLNIFLKNLLPLIIISLVLFNGYRILACDSSDINIAHNPKDEDTYFKHRDAKGFNQLHLNAMYDLLNRIYTDIIIQPARKENEHKAFCDMVDRYLGEAKTIFIVNRDYESYNNLAHVLEKNLFFLVRGKNISSSGILSGLKRLLSLYNFCKIITSHVSIQKCTKKHTYQ